MVRNYQKQIQNKLAKGLLDLILLQFLNQKPMHGYQIISQIRQEFGVYFGPSTVYPLLSALEKKHYLKSTWNLDSDRPKKVYELTREGENALSFTEGTFNLICRTMTKDSQIRIEPASTA
jgi:PadR family transcriptional regulator, regulatory protein PadR